MRNLLRIGLALALIASIGVARAEAPPPHYPGTVCYTPYFWCWLPAPAQPGAPCFCPAPNGNVAGTAG